MDVFAGSEGRCAWFQSPKFAIYFNYILSSWVSAFMYASVKPVSCTFLVGGRYIMGR